MFDSRIQRRVNGSPQTACQSLSVNRVLIRMWCETIGADGVMVHNSIRTTICRFLIVAVAVIRNRRNVLEQKSARATQIYQTSARGRCLFHLRRMRAHQSSMRQSAISPTNSRNNFTEILMPVDWARAYEILTTRLWVGHKLVCISADRMIDDDLYTMIAS